MFFVVLLIVLVLAIIGYHKPKPTVRRCFSNSCKYNKNGNCSLPQIDIYDNNGLIGVCLWHTSSMLDRIPKFFKKETPTKPVVVNKLLKNIENIADKKAITNPEEFKRWMQSHGVELK